jgi:hypothetical protein
VIWVVNIHVDSNGGQALLNVRSSVGSILTTLFQVVFGISAKIIGESNPATKHAQFLIEPVLGYCSFSGAA